jgi:hypothetical protein
MADKPQAAAMPQPGPEHQKLHMLAGKWEGEEDLRPSPWGPGGRAIGRYDMRVAVDGFFVVQDYEEEKDGRVVFRGHGVYGWDANDKVYTWFWVDSMGQMPAGPSRGRWEGDTLTFESASPQGRGRYIHRFEGTDKYTFKLENSFDGGATFVTLMEGTYHRKG